MTSAAELPSPPPPSTDDSSTPVEQLVLLSTFTIRKRVHRVVLHDGQLVWQEERSNARTVLPLSDLISVRLVPPAAAGNNHSSAVPSLLLHYARRNGPSAASPTASNVWRVHSRRLCHTDARTVGAWADALQRHLAASQPRRPRHLLVFVNPFGGRQQSLRIFEKWAKPLFELAGCETDVVVTQRPNQIGDILRRHRLDGLDGVVCVGGDGTVSEMLNGLVQRAIEDPAARAPGPTESVDDVPVENGTAAKPLAGGDTNWPGGGRQLPRPALPVGIIPGGSTDTIAYCLHGTTDIRTAVIHIVLGQRTGLDLASVSDAAGRLIRLYASVMSYGFLGDVAADSERFRWMGPRRYDYSGFKKFIANRGYEGEILIPDDDDEDDDGNARNPDDGILCVERCPRCAARAPTATTVRPRQRSLPPSTTATSSTSTSSTSTSSTSSTDGIEETTAADGTVRRWRVLRGKFFMVNGANLSCACPKSPNGFSRFGHVGDGRVDLVLVRHTPMLYNLRLLQKLSSRTDRISELPFVEIHRVRRFRFRAATAAAGSVSTGLDTSSVMNASTDRVVKDDDEDDDADTSVVNNRRTSTSSSQWNCDGEVITDSDISVESNCQLVNVFRRGPIDPTAERGNESSSACGRLSLCGF